VYQVSGELPASENFGLVLNLRRSAVSVARSIAEGCGRGTDTEFAVDLKRARAACHELEYIVLLCRDLSFLPEPLYTELNTELIEVRKMISGLVNRLSSAHEFVRQIEQLSAEQLRADSWRNVN
jgi:four helix bundle protein